MRWNPFRPKPHRKVHREAWKARALVAERRVAILSALLGPEKLAELAEAELTEHVRCLEIRAERQRDLLYGTAPTAAEPGPAIIDFGPFLKSSAKGTSDAKPAE
jgi:hypothetical protein